MRTSQVKFVHFIGVTELNQWEVKNGRAFKCHQGVEGNGGALTCDPMQAARVLWRAVVGLHNVAGINKVKVLANLKTCAEYA